MLFEDQTKGQDGNQTQQTQTQEDWLAKIVEVKGEAFKDPQVLAKSKLESDNYIKQLESQLTDLRTELNKEDTTKKLLAELQSRRQDPNANSVPKQGETNPSDTKPELVGALRHCHAQRPELVRQSGRLDGELLGVAEELGFKR
mgnify:CR=1 FL=1